ncbi:MAG: leucyl aminopeptidase [Kiritimatiellae bacterium]|nr:leucyl aminopeptidase [Kiritimatiellia bacterium]
MNIRLHSDELFAAPADACVLWVHAGPRGPVLNRARLPEGMLQRTNAWMKRRGFKGDAGAVMSFPVSTASGERLLVLAGLGAAPAPARAHEQAAAAAARHARAAGCARVAFALADEIELGEAALARRIVRGAHIGAYDFLRFRTASPPPAGVTSLVLCARTAKPAAIRRAAEVGRLEGETMNEVRDLANLPGNHAPPAVLADVARRMARKYGLGCRVLGRAEMRRLGMNALLAVAQGSAHEPRLIVLEHRGSGARRRPVALVGKAVTFDAGGISLKPAKGMEWMRYDKCGGMAVLAALAAAARLRLPQPAIGVIAAVENMPDGAAQRPGDIVKSFSGQTIEVLNTDAEGRLVLADALAWVARRKPRAIVDLATLTGAVVVALGHHASGLLSNDDELSSSLRAAGERSGDRLWPLPLWSEYAMDLKSAHADMKNIGDGSAGTIIGGVFLEKFIPSGTPWAHIDIAGGAYMEKETPGHGVGATLFGARLIVDWLEHIGDEK